MEVIKVDFVKDENNKTILTNQENIDKINEFVLPIIEQNEGWGTAELTKENFLKDPTHFQDHIDATVWKNVHILLDKNEPVGLLEFGKSYINDEKPRHLFLQALLQGVNIQTFNQAVNKTINLEYLRTAKEFFKNKPIYSAVGVVLRPHLQNKQSGYTEELYKIISDGLVFGWTSNPIIVRKRRKLFKNTLFFPALNEFPNMPEEWAICLYLYAYVISHPSTDYEGLELGAMYSKYFVSDRGDEYIDLAKQLVEQNKITILDEKRIEYVLNRKSCAGAIFSWN